MIKIVSNSQMQAMDAYTIQELGVPGIILMENAGRQTFEYIHSYLEEHNIAGQIHIYCGKGNNGGDGYVIARYLFNSGFNIGVFSVGNPDELSGDAKTNYLICKNFGISIKVIQSPDQLKEISSPGLIVDALLGTGIKGAPYAIMEHVINFINMSPATVIAVDIPSGLNGDLSTVPGKCIKADITVTMALPKRAHLFYPAKEFTGQLETADIGLPEHVKNSPEVNLNLIEFSDVHFPEIAANAHKYTAGKLFLLAGSTGMTGAASLAAAASLRTGIGLLNIGIPESLNPVMEANITEGLTVPLPETADGMISKTALPIIQDLIDWADAIIIGPGSGRSTETRDVLLDTIDYCRHKKKPSLLDADALYALSSDKSRLNSLGSNFALSPHHGEFRRLTTFGKEEIQYEPWRCLQTFIENQKFCINLKGAPSLVGTAAGQIYVNPTGNVALAKGGSGDVLSGIIGGLLARGLSPLEACIPATYIHGEAADLLVMTQGVSSVLPSDLIQVLPDLLDDFE
jgi:NAD(P)H-hydrate epimerase